MRYAVQVLRKDKIISTAEKKKHEKEISRIGFQLKVTLSLRCQEETILTCILTRPERLGKPRSLGEMFYQHTKKMVNT